MCSILYFVSLHSLASPSLPRSSPCLTLSSLTRSLIVAHRGSGNIQNLNAGIGGGDDGRTAETTKGHSLCGDMKSRSAFIAGGTYGPTDATIQGPFRAGQAVDFKVTVSAYHEGWVEMRLCEERKAASGADYGAATAITQECLNKHVLKLDVAYTQTRKVTAFRGHCG